MSEKVVNTLFGPFDTRQALRFKKAYLKSSPTGEETFLFWFDGRGEHEVLVSLAKYLVEYLEMEGLL